MEVAEESTEVPALLKKELSNDATLLRLNKHKTNRRYRQLKQFISSTQHALFIWLVDFPLA